MRPNRAFRLLWRLRTVAVPSVERASTAPSPRVSGAPVGQPRARASVRARRAVVRLPTSGALPRHWRSARGMGWYVALKYSVGQGRGAECGCGGLAVGEGGRHRRPPRTGHSPADPSRSPMPSHRGRTAHRPGTGSAHATAADPWSAHHLVRTAFRRPTQGSVTDNKPKRSVGLVKLLADGTAVVILADAGYQGLGAQNGGRMVTPPHRKFKQNAPSWCEEMHERQRKAHSSRLHPARPGHRTSEELAGTGSPPRPPRAHERHHPGNRRTAVPPADHGPELDTTDVNTGHTEVRGVPPSTVHKLVGTLFAPYLTLPYGGNNRSLTPHKAARTPQRRG